MASLSKPPSSYLPPPMSIIDPSPSGSSIPPFRQPSSNPPSQSLSSLPKSFKDSLYSNLSPSPNKKTSASTLLIPASIKKTSFLKSLLLLKTLLLIQSRSLSLTASINVFLISGPIH
ncbi:uncharacterized protein G2W53_034996 [Senna tora]|uniref:Uncharacterized protein n=1 Tax=Senna tora TaxID=362788 RepID=A0A834SPC6_9FABA|nr:uncharacterized protein G2W53_034996 [Senna tora]